MKSPLVPLPSSLASSGASKLVQSAYYLVDLVLHIVAQKGEKFAFFGVVSLRGGLHGKERFLVEVFKGQAVGVGGGLVLAVSLPEQPMEKALVYLPELA